MIVEAVTKYEYMNHGKNRSRKNTSVVQKDITAQTIVDVTITQWI